jgi:hypothetical protein
MGTSLYLKIGAAKTFVEPRARTKLKSRRTRLFVKEIDNGLGALWHWEWMTDGLFYFRATAFY